MATTKIDYKERKGFYINEAYIQLAFCYIYQEAKKSQYNFSNKQEILESLQDDINGYTYGYIANVKNTSNEDLVGKYIKAEVIDVKDYDLILVEK